MRFCHKCSAQVGENDKFCTECGRPLKETKKARLVRPSFMVLFILVFVPTLCLASLYSGGIIDPQEWFQKEGEASHTSTSTVTPTPTPFPAVECETDEVALQTAVYIFYYESDGNWPVTSGGDIIWNRLVPSYLLEIPDSDSLCDWHIDSSGLVYPTLDSCPCVTGGGETAAEIVNPTVGYVPQGWYIEEDSPYPSYSDDVEGTWWGLIMYTDPTDFDYVELYYGDVPSDLAGHTSDATSLISKATDYAISEPDETGTMTIAGCTAGYAKSYDAEFDIYYMEIVFVKGITCVDICACYEATVEDEEQVMSLIDSCDLGAAPSPGCKYVWAELEGIRYRELGADWQPIVLCDNPEATDVTWSELEEFLLVDRTDEIPYIDETFICGDYAEMLHNNAEAAGIRAAWVGIDFYGSDEGHAVNAFNTTDRGLVFIDVTNADVAPCSSDIIAIVIEGKQITPELIFPCAEWELEPMEGIVEKITITW